MKNKIYIIYVLIFLLFIYLLVNLNINNKNIFYEKMDEKGDSKEDLVGTCVKNGVGTKEWCHWLHNILPDDSPIKNVEYGENGYQW